MKPTLNKSQAEAVAWNTGPALVLAGPGSGKTAVLTLRAARLLGEDPDASVLALTFTNKAATEMRERVDELLGYRADRAHLCTFHSFATELLRQHGAHVGLRPDFTLLVLDEDRLAFLNEAVEAIPDAEIPGDRRSLLKVIERMFAESYDGEYPASFLANTPSWLPTLFANYCKVLVASNRLDFGALLHFTRQLLSSRDAVARSVRTAWQYICVDEFQDTNKIQYDLLRLIASPRSANLFIVADDDQIIYQWNGASPERLQLLQNDYDMAVMQLPQNYRCPPDIIDLANALIGHNTNRTPGKKPLVAVRAATSASNVEVIQVPSPADEASLIAERILGRAPHPQDCVVLARTRKLLEPMLEALAARGIVAHLPQQKSDFETPACKWMFAALRLGNARHDRELLRRLCVAWETLTDALIEGEAVVADAALSGGDYLRAWLVRAQTAAVTAELGELLGLLREKVVERLNVTVLVTEFLKIGSSVWADDVETVEELGAWRALHDEIVGEHDAENVTLSLYVQEMSLRSKATQSPPGAVRLMTIHGAKGLEFKHVFLVGMAEEVFPSYHAVKAGANKRELEEERRSCFVAITRVQESLTLSRATRYHGYPKTASRFLREMGLDA
jgi:DNA helicase II / ATP-dependent DNA helicase PcrA